MPLLQVQNVKKRYGDKQIVKGISFSVEKGESFGLLGPNGAGKSTLISMICGLNTLDEGDVWVGGHSVKKDPMSVKRKIGVVPQDIALYPTISAIDNLLFWGRMYGLSGKELRQKTDEVLEIIDLKDRAKEPVETFSGGMKRRVNIGAALLHEPELLIMDEPTVGIDPQSRNHILETVKMLNGQGMSIIYTSHYMEEVEYLCSRVGIIDHGELIALGTKNELCEGGLGVSCIKVSAQEEKLSKVSQDVEERLTRIDGVERITIEGGQISIFAKQANPLVGEIVNALIPLGLEIGSIEIQEANLETIFLQLTGRKLRD
jgi:ABC-2 type transport system ATP-binding protein